METYEEHIQQMLAAGGAHECASDCPLPAMTEERVPTTSLYVELRDAISEHIERAARETGTYHGDPTATSGGTGYCIPAAVATQIVDKYLLERLARDD